MHKILIIEDEETIRHYITILLGTIGYETIEASSGAKGIELAARHKPDIILMDIMMPGMDGIEACENLKEDESLENIPVLMVTAKTDDATMEKAFDAGAFDYISKPLNKLEMTTRIRSALNYKKLDDIRRKKDAELEMMVEERTAELASANEKLRLEIEERIGRERRLSFLEKALETIDLGVTIADMKGRIIYSNPAEAAMHGYTVEELTGKDVGIFAPPEARRTITQKMINEGKSKRRETINLRKDGSKFPVYLISTIVEDSQGKPVAVVAACKDITERKRAEETRLQLEAQLRQVQKMETIGTLAGGIAHDFNNILTPILTYADIALSEVDDIEIKNYFSTIYSAGERARDLVSQILAFSRQAELEMQPLKMNYIVREALALIRHTIPATIEIKRNIKSDIAVLADPTQLHQIVMNLCTNAFHAMEESGGKLTVSLTDTKLDTTFISTCPGLMPGEHIKLSVSDSGCGMTKEVMDKIFDPFFTTKATGKGTGMGLAVVHGIIKSHKGAITVESVAGKGSTFNVYLPQANESEGSIKNKPMKSKSWQGNVLVVDDDEIVAESIKKLLKMIGFDAKTVTDSKKALDIFIKEPDLFDLVITDMTMPDMMGDRLSEELLKIRPDIPIIICTGFSQHIDETIAKKLGIKAFIMKPLLSKELEAAIEEAIDKKHVTTKNNYQI